MVFTKALFGWKTYFYRLLKLVQMTRILLIHIFTQNQQAATACPALWPLPISRFVSLCVSQRCAVLNLQFLLLYTNPGHITSITITRLSTSYYQVWGITLQTLCLSQVTIVLAACGCLWNRCSPWVLWNHLIQLVIYQLLQHTIKTKNILIAELALKTSLCSKDCMREKHEFWYPLANAPLNVWHNWGTHVWLQPLHVKNVQHGHSYEVFSWNTVCPLTNSQNISAFYRIVRKGHQIMKGFNLLLYSSTWVKE